MSDTFFSSCEILEFTDAVDVFLKNYLQRRQKDIAEYSPQLFDSMMYSLFTGGKRFRPVLCLATFAKSQAFASALEMVHTYSLIHDDLPCMDNDDFRRGVPTNHKKFGEALALLAGDALLTESFLVISESYPGDVASKLILLLARASGASGMIGGQAMDMNLGLQIDGIDSVKRIHLGKTAELIAAAVEGAGIVEGASAGTLVHLRKVGLSLGLCFQIKDDLLDGEQDQSPKSFLHFLSKEKTQDLLMAETQMGLQELLKLGGSYQKLEAFFHYNVQREK